MEKDEERRKTIRRDRERKERYEGRIRHRGTCRESDKTRSRVAVLFYLHGPSCV